jgi:hypothetical protein
MFLFMLASHKAIKTGQQHRTEVLMFPQMIYTISFSTNPPYKTNRTKRLQQFDKNSRLTFREICMKLTGVHSWSLE